MGDDEPSPTVGDRIRYRLETRLSVGIAALLVLALLGGYVAVQTHTAPATTTEPREAASWSANASFDHEATVQRDTIAFSEGQVLENRQLYFARATPILGGTYTFTHDGDAEDVDVETELTLVLRSVDRSDEETVVYWNVTQPLGTTESTDLDAGENHTVDFSVNVSEQQQLANAIEEELMASPGSREVVVVAETTGTADLAGEGQNLSRTDELRAQPAGVTYRVDSEIQDGHSDTVTEMVEVPVDRDPLPAYGAPLVAVLALLAAAGLAYLDRNDRLAVTPATARLIERDRERGRFDEWISSGQIVIDDGDRIVEMESLEDLVDVAIDANERVVYDGAVGWYVVIDGDVLYRYDEGDDSAGAEPSDETSDGAEPTDGTDDETSDEASGEASDD